VSYWRTVWVLLRKDLRIEARSRETFVSMSFLALLLVVAFGFAFDARPLDPGTEAAGLLWIAISFAGVLGLGRTLGSERDGDCLRALLLAPIDRSAIFVAKWILNLTLLLAMELCLLPLFSVFLRVPLRPALPELVGIVFLSTMGFAAVGTLLATISSGSRLREALLPLLLYPLWVPILVASVKLTSLALIGRSVLDGSDWLVLIGVYDLVFLVAGTLLFDLMVEE